jgi:hypothetical protein
MRLLKRQAAAGREVSPETDFDGKWITGDDEVIDIRGRGTDLRLRDRCCHLKPLSAQTCELMIFGSDGNDLLNVVTGRLSADFQRLEWASGSVWKRIGGQDTTTSPANLRLQQENESLRAEVQRLQDALSARGSATP